MKLLQLFILTLGFTFATNAYVDKPVLSHIRISGQHDTIGFNLAKDLPDFIYKHIEKGDITLWGSPQKRTKLNLAALQVLEKTSETKFNNCSDIFLHEYWDCSPKKIRFVTAGISFIYNQNGKLKPYGFIDARDVFKLLATNLIPTNQNAPARLTYLQALNSKRYNFTIVQYGRKQFTEKPLEAVTLKEKIFNGKRKIDPSVVWENSKTIGYELEDDYLIDYDISQNLKKGLEKYLNNNRSLIKSHDNGQFYDSGDYKGYFKVSGLEIYEVWQKKGQLLLTYTDSMVVYVNNQKLRAFSHEEIRQITFRIKFKSVIDILQEKSFKLNIFSINRILIEPKNQKLYKKALEDYNWTQLTEYVNYENTRD